MQDLDRLFAVLADSSDAVAADTIRRAVLEAPDRQLCRVNPLAFASRHKLDDEACINTFLHAASLGLFDISWNVLCPGCGGVLETSATLQSVIRNEYACALCAQGYEPTLDELVEVTFTVNPRVRRIAAHSPHQLPAVEYLRQLYWGSAIDIPEEGFEEMLEGMVLESAEVPTGERLVISMQLPPEFVIVFEPVTHTAQFIDVKGEATRERRSLSLVYDNDHSHNATLEMHPGPVRIAIDNRTEARILPTVFVAGEALHHMLGQRRSFLTGKRLLTNQTFRDLYRNDTVGVEQRLKITSLTFLFTDLRGSTELYERVGDLVAFDMVRSHFSVLRDIVASETGAVVKTIGDAVMATFPTPDRAVAAALRMREAMLALNAPLGRDDLLLKIGIHEGSCIAVSMNDRQDYFGQTVNIASRVQNLANTQAIFATGAVVRDPRCAEVLARRGLAPLAQKANLRGIDREVEIFAIP